MCIGNFYFYCNLSDILSALAIQIQFEYKNTGYGYNWTENVIDVIIVLNMQMYRKCKYIADYTITNSTGAF